VRADCGRTLWSPETCGLQGSVVRGRMSGCKVAERVKQLIQKNVRERTEQKGGEEKQQGGRGAVAEYMRSSDQTVEMR